ncbi:MAG: hypothetical protein KF812_12030 [Fimbriimonadaceae bacterium]|nr:hypothetical protein [Fimbriimonadaceae bacterium]
MPTYVYECRKCERVFEVMQRMVEDPLTDCECGAKGSLRRVIQPAGVVFRGSGFHVNDYAGTTAPSESSPAPTESPDAPSSAVETKSESPKADQT